MDNDDDDNFISGIHNYCDRWCERCEFTARCRVFAMEQEMTDDEKGGDNEAFARNLANILADAKKMLVEKAEEMGIDLSDVNVGETTTLRREKRSKVRSERLAELAEKYAFDTLPVLEAKDQWLGTTGVDAEIIDDVFAVLYWYQFFIAAKLQRGISGIIDDEDGTEDRDQLIDTQSDANGSVKIGLIAVERSILAWTYLLSKENSSTVRPMIELLEKIKLMAEQKFPYAHDFVRPGFDEIETVM